MQIIIAICLIVVTVTIAAIGVALIFILKEFKYSMQRVNQILGDATEISEAVKQPVLSIGEMLVGVRDGMRTVNSFLGKAKK